MIQEELGRPAAELFAAIEHTPIAAASLAQVHRATLAATVLATSSLQCKDVVIKVQRRGIRGVIESDLRNLRYLVRRMAKEDSKLDYTAMIDEWAEDWAEIERKGKEEKERDGTIC